MSFIEDVLQKAGDVIDKIGEVVNDTTAKVFGEGVLSDRVSVYENSDTKVNKTIKSFQTADRDKVLENIDKLSQEEKAKALSQVINFKIIPLYKNLLSNKNVPKFELYNEIANLNLLTEKYPNLKQIVEEISPLTVINKLDDTVKQQQIANYFIESQKALQKTTQVENALSLGALALTGIGTALSFIPTPQTVVAGRVLSFIGGGLFGGSLAAGVYRGIEEGKGITDIARDEAFDIAGTVIGLRSDYRDLAKLNIISKITSNTLADDLLKDNLSFYTRQPVNIGLENVVSNLEGSLYLSQKTNDVNILQKTLDYFKTSTEGGVKPINADLYTTISTANLERNYLDKINLATENYFDYFKSRGFLTGDTADLEKVYNFVMDNKDDVIGKTINIGDKEIKITPDDVNAFKDFRQFTTDLRLGQIWQEALRSKSDKIVVEYRDKPVDGFVSTTDEAKNLTKEDIPVKSGDIEDFVNENPSIKFAEFSLTPENFISVRKLILENLDNDHIKIRFTTPNEEMKVRVIRQNYIPTSDKFMVGTGTVAVKIGDEVKNIEIDDIAVPLSTPERAKDFIKSKVEKVLKDEGITPEKYEILFNQSDLKFYLPASNVFPYKLRQIETSTGRLTNKIQKVQKLVKDRLDTLQKELELKAEIIPSQITKEDVKLTEALEKIGFTIENSFENVNRLEKVSENLDKLKDITEQKLGRLSENINEDLNKVVAKYEKATAKFMDSLNKIINDAFGIQKRVNLAIENSNEKSFNFAKTGKGFAVKFQDVEKQKNYLENAILGQAFSSTSALGNLTKLYNYMNEIEKYLGRENLSSTFRATKTAVEMFLNKTDNPLAKVNRFYGSLLTLLKPQIVLSNTITNFILINKLIPSLPVRGLSDFKETLKSEWNKLLLGRGIYSVNKFNPIYPVSNALIESYIKGALKNATEEELRDIVKDISKVFRKEEDVSWKNELLEKFKQDKDFATAFIYDLVSGINPAVLPEFLLRPAPIMQMITPWYQFIATPFASSLNILYNWKKTFKSKEKLGKYIGKSLGLSLLAGVVLGEGGVSEFAPVEATYSAMKQFAYALSVLTGDDDLYKFFKSETPITDTTIKLLVKDEKIREEMFKGIGDYILRHSFGLKDGNLIDKFILTGYEILSNLRNYNVLSSTAGSVYMSLPTPLLSTLSTFGLNWKNLTEDNSIYTKYSAMMKIAETIVPILRNVKEALYGKELAKGLYTYDDSLIHTIGKDEIYRTTGVLATIGFLATFLDKTIDNNLITNSVNMFNDVINDKLGTYAKTKEVFEVEDAILRKIDLSRGDSYDNVETVNFILNKAMNDNFNAYKSMLSRIVKTADNQINKFKDKSTVEDITKAFRQLNNITLILAKQKDELEKSNIENTTKQQLKIILDAKSKQYALSLEIIRQKAKNLGIDLDKEVDYNDYIKILQK